MMRLLIVDDESIFRMGLQSCIRWQENGIELVGEAANGKDALGKIEALHPDVVLLDIKMPVMDGVETLRRALPAHPEICFIMLSCMDDYEYVRETMKIGAFDYLFKPVMDAKAILQVMHEARKRILTSKKERTTAPPTLLQRQSEALQAYCMSAKPLPENLLPEQPYHVLRIRLLRCQNDCYLPPTAQMTQVAVSLLRSDRSPYRETPFFLLSADSLALFWPGGLMPEEAGNWFIREFTSLTGGMVVIGCAAKTQSAEASPAVMKEAQRVLDCAFFAGMNTLYHFREDEMQERNFQQLYQTEYQAALACAAQADAQGMQNNLIKVTQDVCKRRLFDKAAFCNYIISLVIDSMRLYHQRIVVEDLFKDHYNMIAEIEKSETSEEALLRFAAIIAQVFRHLCMEEHSSYAPLIERIQHYLMKNYGSNISLSALADSVSMNPSYLCTLYKRETGKNLFTFLMETRMDAACRLLRESDMKTYEVAQAVGYNDYRNFCRTFKRQTGTSPSQYRITATGD